MVDIICDEREQGSLRRGRDVWCMKCERAYRSFQYSLVGTVRSCPFGCLGAVKDYQWEWAELRRNRPDYPPRPEAGRTYPLFPSTSAGCEKTCS